MLHTIFQSTPALDGSSTTVAAKGTSVPEGADAGGACVMVTPVIVERMVTLAETALLRSVAERAMTVTVLCAGTARGAVKIAVAPLAVCGGEKDPQLGALPQLATQSTPAPAKSLPTVAETCALLFTNREEGGACVIAMEIIGVVSDAFVLVALAEQPASPKTAARPSIKHRIPTQVLCQDCSVFVLGVSQSFPTQRVRPRKTDFHTLPCERLIIP